MGKSIMPLFKSFELSLASSVSTVLYDQSGRYGNIHKMGRLKIYLFFFYLYKSNVHHYKLYKAQFFEYRTIQVCRKSWINLNKFNAKILLIFQARWYDNWSVFLLSERTSFYVQKLCRQGGRGKHCPIKYLWVSDKSLRFTTCD